MATWEDDAVVAAGPSWQSDEVVGAPGGKDRRSAPRVASGFFEAAQAGYQGGVRGLEMRQKLPDVVLDPHHAKWYEKLASSATQMVTELPEMTLGAVIGGSGGAAAGSLAGPVGTAAGGVLGAGAGAFGVPTAIRESLMQYYESREVDSSGDFLRRAGIVVKATAKDAAVGALTFGAGGVAARTVGKAVAPAMGTAMTVNTGRALIGAADATAQVGAMTVAPAALEGKLPEPEDFMNAAIMVAGGKAAGHAATKIRQVFAETGVRPEQVVGDARVDPEIAKQLADPTLPGIPEQYRAVAGEVKARDAVPDLNAARAFVEQPFAEIPQAPGTPKIKLNVNYEHIMDRESIGPVLARATELYGPQIVEQTRGTVTWEATEADARARLSALIGGKEPISPREVGTADNATELLVRANLMQGAVENFTTLSRAHNPLTATPMEKAQMLAAAERVAMLSAEFQGATAEAGRALNILKDTKGMAMQAEAVAKMLNDYGRNPDVIAKMMHEVDNPVAAARAARMVSEPTLWQKIVEGGKSFMISGPITFAANVIGNFSEVALRPIIDAAALPVGIVRGNALDANRVRAIEPVARVVGNFQGAYEALHAAAAWMRIYGNKPAMEGLRDLDKGSNPKVESQHAIAGDKGVIIRAPFLGLSVVDRLFVLMNERGEANASAARQAAKEGHNPFTREFRERMAELAQNPTEKMQADITAAGERFTFNSELGTIGKAGANLIRESGSQWLFPFIRTPANIAKEVVRMTPFAPLIDTWRADIAKGGAHMDKALAEAFVGGTLTTLVGGMVLSENISGAGEPDPSKKRVKMASGWQPYSVKIGDTWHDYSRIQPVGTLLGLAADMVEVQKHMTPEESDKISKMLATAFANAITNQTMLQGLSNIVRATAEPDRFGARFVQGLAGMPIPSLLAQSAQLHDPYVREIDSMLDAIKNRLPGARETLLPQRDPYGEPVVNRERTGFILPSRESKMSTDLVRTEAARLGVGVAKAPNDLILPAGHDRQLGKVKLTPEEQDVYAKTSGQMAMEILKPIVNSESWTDLPDMVKKRTYDVVFERARKVGAYEALPMARRLEEADRIANEITKRLAP